VITIENLTTFFRWEEKDALIIYLGGYHNRVRRTLLEKIYREMPEIQYLHFGDIDVGGFEIYEDLCRKTGIPFLPYHMGIEELRMYREFSRPLTENDKRRLKRLMEQAESDGPVSGNAAAYDGMGNKIRTGMYPVRRNSLAFVSAFPQRRLLPPLLHIFPCHFLLCLVHSHLSLSDPYHAAFLQLPNGAV